MKERRNRIGKEMIGLAAGILMTLCNYGPVAAETKKKDMDKKWDVSWYGQINRAVLYTDDGENTDLYHVDNDNSSSRIGAKVTAAPNDRLTVGGQLEFEYQSNASNNVGQGMSNTTGDQLSERIIEAYLSGQFGKLSLGQGKTASDTTSEQDLSGTKVIGFSNVQALAGGMQFVDNSSGTLLGVKVKDVFNHLDGLGLSDRARYDSPKMNGFQVALSTVSEDGDDGEDIALFYAGNISSTKVATAISYVNYNSSSSYKSQTNGSFSILLPQGINVTLAAGNRDPEDAARDDPSFYYAKVGYMANIFSVGSTAMAVDYGNYKNIKQNKDDADSMGLMCVQKLKEWNTELYLAYRVYQLDRETANLNDIIAVMAGLCIKF